jgi:hypothetical protein
MNSRREGEKGKEIEEVRDILFQGEKKLHLLEW